MSRHTLSLLVCALSIIACPMLASAQDATTTKSTDAKKASKPSDGAVVIRIGALASTRALELTGDLDTLQHKPGTYVGGALGLDIFLKRFDDINASLGLSINGGYAGAKNAEVSPDIGREPITEIMYGSATVSLVRNISSSFWLETGAGVQLTSILVEPNFRYTGHRYISALVRVAAQKGVANNRFLLGGGINLLPNLSTNQSNGADGEASAFGVEANARVGVNLMNDNVNVRQSKLGLFLEYTYRRFASQYPEDNRFGAIGARGVDTQNALQLSLQYSL